MARRPPRHLERFLALILLPAFIALSTPGHAADSAPPERSIEGVEAPEMAAPGLASGLSREAWTELQRTLRRDAARPTAVAALGDVGGPDVIVATNDTLFYGLEVDVANNGDIYVLLHRRLELALGLFVYRSVDGGSSWSQWGLLSPGPTNIDGSYDIHVADGSPARVFVAWNATPEIRVAWSPLGSAAAWTEQAAITIPTGSVIRPSITSDVVDFPTSYFVYLATGHNAGSTGNIQFARSTNQGDTWEAEYAIASGTFATGYPGWPEIEYGNNVLHAVWEIFGDNETRIEHRRALNFASAGLSDWQSTTIVTQAALSDTNRHRVPFVAPSRTSNSVVIAIQRSECFVGPQPGSLAAITPNGTCGATIGKDVIVRTSSDAGATWPAGNEARILGTLPRSLEPLPTGSGFALVVWPGLRVTAGLRTAADATPLIWSDESLFTDRPYDLWSVDGMPDPSNSGRLALAFVVSTPPGSLFADAEWRGDPGFPALDAGGPLPLFAGGITPPALGELDGDQQLEIVFGAADGFIEAFNHDGSNVAGWPVFVGAFPAHIPFNATIAVSDLDLNGQFEVVAGNAAGEVHVVQNTGALRTGWPVSISNGEVFVSVGQLLNSSPRQIVAVTAGQVYLLNPDGTTAPGWPQTINLPVVGAAAIGDVDNDGTREIVAVGGGQVKIFAPNGTTELSLTIPSTTFSDQPSLADMDVDNDLEIAMPTVGGLVHLIHHTGTTFGPGWPFTGSTGTPIPAVALAFMRASDIDVVVAERDTTVHMLDSDGNEWSGWPNNTGEGWFIRGGPTVDFVEGPSSDVIIGSRASEGYSWTNFGVPIGGWPTALSGQCEVSPASGDIDQDGDLEVVFVTLTHLNIFDVGNPPRFFGIDSTWPMYGHDAERTACLACEDNRYPVSVDPPMEAITNLQLAPPFPNPSSGSLTIDFALPRDSDVRITMLDVSGRRVGKLLSRAMPAGRHRWTWRGQSGGQQLPAGVYYVRLDAGGETANRRVVLMP